MDAEKAVLVVQRQRLQSNPGVEKYKEIIRTIILTNIIILIVILVHICILHYVYV